MNTFEITQQIEKVFPDIQGQLCSKHSVLLSSITNSFSKAYPLHTPTHYIVAKQPLILIQGGKLQVEMGMEQGVTLMLSASDEDEKMNLWLQSGEQIVLQNSGKVINMEVQEQLTLLASKAISLAVQDLSLSKTKGGFIYIYFPQVSDPKSVHTQHTLLIALFMAAITINDLVEQYSIQDLINKLKTLQEFSDNDIVENYFKFYRNRELLISGEIKKNVKIDKKYKFLVMSLAFLEQQLSNLNQNVQLDQLIVSLGSNEIELAQFFTKIQQLQSQQIQGSKVKTFIEGIKSQTQIKATLYMQHYCLFIVETFRYNQILNKIAKCIHNKLEKQQQEKIYNKKQAMISRQIIQSLLFSCMPSTGVAVIDPRNSMWF